MSTIFSVWPSHSFPSAQTGAWGNGKGSLFGSIVMCCFALCVCIFEIEIDKIFLMLTSTMLAYYFI
jgi:hypothetical protein